MKKSRITVVRGKRRVLEIKNQRGFSYNINVLLAAETVKLLTVERVLFFEYSHILFDIHEVGKDCYLPYYFFKKIFFFLIEMVKSIRLTLF